MGKEGGLPFSLSEYNSHDCGRNDKKRKRNLNGRSETRKYGAGSCFRCCWRQDLFSGCGNSAGTELPAEQTADGSGLEVHFIDVGQADAALVLCDGESMLIDGGNSEDSDVIYTYLEKPKVEELDYMVCTHAHEDHVGGLSGALTYASVDTALAPVTEYDSRAFRNFSGGTGKAGG